MSGTSRSGSDRSDSSGRSLTRRSWALPGRRGTDEPGEPVLPALALPADTALHALPVRPAEPAAEEHHLGERLSAFLDGELGHDSRERVQAHLATCPQCLAEADEGRAVKHLLTGTGTPGPSPSLMARLMAVGNLPEDGPADGDWPPGRGRRDDDDDLPGGGVAATGTLGGSRLTGGSFGRGAGASFGAGALGADTPVPGVDPRAFGRGAVLRPLMGRRSARPEPTAGEDRSARTQPAAAAVRAPARGRRLVFAAAGAFSVAAVTLGGVGGLSPQGEERHGTTVSPAGGNAGTGRGGLVPMTAQVPVDFPGRPVAATREASPPSSPERYPGGLAAQRQQTR
ncbi:MULTISPECIES: zf-HC2 domain-containing protein [Streptomyces]|uniref:zf-HC2 domain-containing protein n=1 Tax=Streptomyces TaxID=1883 RepID=UPI0006894A3D|nr:MULTISPECIES: zf-HC2 domain-containing protein [Streptomyces]